MGHLIHNPTYLKRLEDRGVFSLEMDEVEKIAAESSSENPIILFLRAHGVPRETELRLKKLCDMYPYFSYVDCTCPYVKKIHNIAADCVGDDHIFVLLGDEKHPEVVGIMSYFDGEKYVFSSSEELESSFCQTYMVNLHKKTPVFVAQTTYNLSESKNYRKTIYKINYF